MKRESPAEARKAMVVVEALIKAGIGFVPMPILGEEDRQRMIKIVDIRLDMIGGVEK